MVKTIYHESFFFMLLALFLSLPLSTQARDIYTWRDSNGVTHFSQSPPEQTEAKTKIIQIEESNSEIKWVDQTPSILEIANQFERARLARERARFERRLSLARLQYVTERRELESTNSNKVQYVPVYYPRFKRHHKHRHKHRHSKRCYPHCGKGRNKHPRQTRQKHERAEINQVVLY